ncbi:hypothetical protein ABZ801_35345 [Actinomadura sp. NPDC047616]|uniref:hypothetical protein n=1 Tax=Actinomadura sp. NPDC047616 TaxID=3155914 RepID=UPI00340B465E
MFSTTIDVVAIGHTGGEPHALRGLLAEYGADVRLLPIGAPQHLADVLGGRQSRAEHLVLCCHGDERGILLDELAPEIARSQPFNDVLTPENAAELTRLSGTLVVSTGCMTGTEAFAEAFMRGGCSAYIAPEDYLEGTAAIAFVSVFYYHLLQLKTPLPDAVRLAANLGGDTTLFRLWN